MLGTTFMGQHNVTVGTFSMMCASLGSMFRVWLGLPVISKGQVGNKPQLEVCRLGQLILGGVVELLWISVISKN